MQLGIEGSCRRELDLVDEQLEIWVALFEEGRRLPFETGKWPLRFV